MSQNVTPVNSFYRRRIAPAVCALVGHRHPPFAPGRVFSPSDLVCLRCGVLLGLPVTTQAPTVPQAHPPHQVQSRPRWLIIASQSYGEPRWTIYRRRRLLWFGWWEYASYVTSHPEAAALIDHLSQPDTVVWSSP